MHQPRYNEDHESDGHRTRRNIGNLLMANELSGQRAQDLFNDAHADGFRGYRKLAKPGRKHAGNTSRDLRRKLKKMSRHGWPAAYHAKITVMDKKTQREKQVWLPMLLPHEIVEALLRHTTIDKLVQETDMDSSTSAHLQDAKRKLGMSSDQPLMGLGLWADGVPCNWDRTESVEVFTLNVPGIRVLAAYDC
jgi:hypothetical protein